MFPYRNIASERQVDQNIYLTCLKKTGWTLLSILILSLALFFILSSSSASAALYGDINKDGEINVQDVVLTMRYVLGLQELNSIQKIAADVNNDNLIDVTDVTLIMRKSLGLIETFPALASPEFSLVKEGGFSVHEGLSPGRKLVIITLIVDDPQNYEVFVEGRVEPKLLEFSNSINNELVEPYFYGEVDEDYAKIEYVKVKSK